MDEETCKYANITIKSTTKYAKTLALAEKEDDEQKQTSNVNTRSPVVQKAIETDSVLNPKCLVHFRINRWGQKYKGEYGFDWLRSIEDIEDTEGNKYKYSSYTNRDYKEIVGENGDPKTFKPDKNLYDNLKGEYSKHSFKVPWKDSEGNPYTYYASWLCLLPGKEATLDLLIEINEPPKSLIIKYDSDYFDLIYPNKQGNIKDIREKGKRYNVYNTDVAKNGVTIKCKKKITEEKLIKAYADGKECGRMIVVPNAKIYDMKVTFVKAYMYERDEGLMYKINFEKIENWLNNEGFNQALINCLISKLDNPQSQLSPEYAAHSISFDLNGRDKKLRKKYIDKRTNKNNEEKECFVKGGFIEYIYEAYIKKRQYAQEDHELIYFYTSIPSWIDERSDFAGGIAQQYTNKGKIRGAGVAFIFDWDKGDRQSKSTHLHEGGHALSLPHSFHPESKHTFLESETYNIMDYVGGSGVIQERFIFWRWQWYVMQKTLEEGFYKLI